MRSVLLISAVLAGSLAATARAQEVTPDRCETLLRLAGDSARAGGSDLQARYSGLTDGTCAYSDVVIRLKGRYAPVISVGTVTIAGTVLNWKPDGSAGSVGVSLTAGPIRMAVESGDARMDYMLEAQSRLGEMQFALEAGWDAAAKTLRVRQFDLRIGEASQVRFAALVKNVDLSTPGAAQMALTGSALTELDLEVKSFGLFEQFILPALIPLFPDSSDADSASEFAALVAEQKRGLRTAINELPDAAFPAPSRTALAALLSDLPNPRGKLVVAFRSASGFGAARFMRFALRGVPASMKELAPLFDDTRFDIDWRRGDRS